MTSLANGVPYIAFEALEPAAQTAFQQSPDGRGPWYRTVGRAPVERLPVRVLNEGPSYAIGLERQYNVGPRRGKLPLVTLALCSLSFVAVLMDPIRYRGGLAVLRRWPERYGRAGGYLRTPRPDRLY